MNPEVLNREIVHAVGPLFAALVLMGSGAFGMHVYHTALKPLPNGTPDVVCYEMPQSDLRGWKRVPEVERDQLSYRAAQGKVRMREETSLQCRQYLAGDARIFTAREWWYRTAR